MNRVGTIGVGDSVDNCCETLCKTIDKRAAKGEDVNRSQDISKSM